MSERIRDGERGVFFSFLFFCLSTETWATAGVKCWEPNPRSLRNWHIQQQFPLCVSVCEWQSEGFKWAVHTQPLDSLIEWEEEKGDRDGDKGNVLYNLLLQKKYQLIYHPQCEILYIPFEMGKTFKTKGIWLYSVCTVQKPHMPEYEFVTCAILFEYV